MNKFYKVISFPVFLHASETWTLTMNDKRQVQITEISLEEAVEKVFTRVGKKCKN